MSMPLKILEDKPLIKEDFEPYKMVSLLDLLEFHARKFVVMCNFLASISHHIDDINDRLARGDLNCGMPMSAVLLEVSEDWKDDILSLKETLNELGLACSVSAADALLRPVDLKVRDWEWKQLEINVAHLLKSIRSELGERSALMIPIRRATFYKEESTFLGEEILRKCRNWPSLENDAIEAGNCFALGRYTACVFHLMRILEYLVQQFGRKPQVTIPDLHKKTWGKILKEIKDKINGTKQSRGMPYETPRQRNKKDRYDRFYAVLDSICRALRNPMMHKITDFPTPIGEEQAQKLIGDVKQLVQDYLALR